MKILTVIAAALCIGCFAAPAQAAVSAPDLSLTTPVQEIQYDRGGYYRHHRRHCRRWRHGRCVW